MSRSAKRPEPTGGDRAAEIRRKLAAGRSMSALKEAKDFAKRDGSPEALALLAEAYAARIADLRQAGMLAEAQELVGVARERFPELAASWDGAARDVAHATGDLGATLRQWVADPASRDELTAVLRRATRDPAWVADSSELPPDDPLRLAAVALRTAFEQAAAGALGDAAREGLRAVGRKSPLVPWRSLVLAVDAFHRRDDDRCREALGAILDDDATAPARDVLRAALLDGPPPRDGAARRALLRLVGAMPAAAQAAERLRGVKPRDREFVAVATALLRELSHLGRRPTSRFLFLLASWSADSAGEVLASSRLGESWFGNDAMRIAALLEPEDAAQTVAGFAGWLLSRVAAGSEPSAIEVGLVLERIDRALEDFAAELSHLLETDVMARWSRGDPVDGILRAWLREWVADEAAEILFTGFALWQQLFVWLENRTGVARRGLPARVELLRQAVALDPTAPRFAALFRALDGDRDRLLRDELLDAWCAAIPSDPTPWLHRAETAQQRGAIREVEEHLAAAERLAPADPRIRTLRAQAALESLRRAAQRGETQACRDALTRLAGMPIARRPQVRQFLAAAARRLGQADAVSTETIAGAAAAEPDDVRSLDSLAAHLLNDRAAEVFSPELPGRLTRAARIAALAAEFGRPLSKLPDGLGPLQDVEPAHLPGNDEELLALCELGASARAERLRQLAAGAGIRRETPLLARFLAHRALSLPGNHTRRIQDCARLASHFATRLGDVVAQRMLHEVGGFPVGLLDDATAREMLGRERAAPDGAVARKKKASRRAQRGPVQRELFGPTEDGGDGAASGDPSP